MRTWTGSWAPLIEGEGEVNILDIVMKLGRETRWGSYGSPEYKVLHHTLLVALIWLKNGFPPDGLVHILSHDFHETYTGDVPSPLKRLLKEFGPLEKGLDHRIRETLGIPKPDDRTLRMVRLCDWAALVIEAPLFGPPGATKGGMGPPTEGYDALNVKWPSCFDHPDLPAELRPEIVAVVRKAIPNFDAVLRARASVL